MFTVLRCQLMTCKKILFFFLFFFTFIDLFQFYIFIHIKLLVYINPLWDTLLYSFDLHVCLGSDFTVLHTLALKTSCSKSFFLVKQMESLTSYTSAITKPIPLQQAHLNTQANTHRHLPIRNVSFYSNKQTVLITSFC